MVPSLHCFGFRLTIIIKALDRTSIGCELSNTTKSDDTISLAKKWIAECSSTHKQCKTPSTNKRWYPTRLVDCGVLGDSEPLCRLIETRATILDGPYLTLSHCWGLAKCLQLTADNYDELLGGIPLRQLPQLYQDATYVTLKLGIRHIWIDSLCIIQEGDESADWRREVGLMSKVYSNSFCNISALDAPDGNHSLFSSRNPDAHRPQITNLNFDGHLTQYLVSDNMFWATEIHRARVNTRAWVLQERLLCPRILNFGERQMFWECREKDAAEVYPGGLPPVMPSEATRFKDLVPQESVATSMSGSHLEARFLWARIVRAYSACHLTFPGDKLIALSAVVDIMSPILEDECVAGMWRRYLECELLWSVTANLAGKLPRPEVYRAPSWSWAAVDGVISPSWPGNRAVDELFVVEGLHLEYSAECKSGPLYGGWLRLRGVLKKLELMPMAVSLDGSNFHHSAINYGGWKMVVNGVTVSVPQLSGEVQPFITLDSYQADFDRQNSEGALYCMPGRLHRDAVNLDDEEVDVLLLELEDRERGVFRRIGLARGVGQEVAGNILARDMGDPNLPCEEYQDGKHLICII